jgi:hypothetical protein
MVSLAHCADQLAGEQVVGGKGRVGGIGRIERGVERDDQQAGIARLLDLIDDALGVGSGDQDTLGAIGDAAFDRRNLAFAVAVDLAGVGLQRDAEFLGLGRRAFLHLDEEGVGIGLGDEAGGYIRGHCRSRKGDAERQRAERCRRTDFFMNSSQSVAGAAP